MVEKEPTKEILRLSNDAIPTECPVFHPTLDSENYGDLFSPFGTPPNKHLNVDPLSYAPDENCGKHDVSDPLILPEGSPVTPQLQESSTLLSELEIENQEHPTPFDSKLLQARQIQENHCLERSFAIANMQTTTNHDQTTQVRHSMETDFQELLELGKAMNLPSGPAVGTVSFCPAETGGSTQDKQDETSDSIALLPFPLDDIFTPLEKEEIATEEHNCANRNLLSLTPNVTQSYPDSAAAIVDTEIGTSHQNFVSKQQGDPKPVNIDEILQEVASRNSGRCKRGTVVEGTQSNETSTEASFKKRKMTSSTGESDREADALCSTNRSKGQKKKSPKKVQRCNRTVPEISGKAQTSPGSTPSRFCHICTRAAKPDVILVCGNVARGTCRKVICFKCIRDMSWDWGSLEGSEPWTCTHCRQDCPAKAQCHTYRRVNQNRRADGRRSRKTRNTTSAGLVESNSHISN